MVLHSLEEDDTISGGFYSFLGNPELASDAELLDFVFDKMLRTVCKCFLYFSYANGSRSWLSQTCFNQEFSEEMTFSRSASTVGTLVSTWFQERDERSSGRNIKLCVH